MTEFDLIYQIFAKPHGRADSSTSGATIIKAIGDDAAVIAPVSGQQLVTCTDTLVQGRHFSDDWSQVHELAFAIGYKAVAVNLSDLAAMGATPHSILLAIALPEQLANATWLSDFAKGLFHACEQFDVTLIGGDTTRHDKLVITITAQGYVPSAYGAVYRDGAKVGDKLYVSGTLGDASYALKHSSSDIGQQLAHRLHMPTPRVALGTALARPPHRATAMMDISDGLYQDLSHICQQSRVSMRLNLDAFPMSNIMQSAPMQSHLVHQLTGGDDYELAFTLPADATPPDTPTAVTCIGEVIAADAESYQPQLYYQGQAVTEKNPFPFDYMPKLKGYQHFND